MVELREPIGDLICDPCSHTSHLRFPDPSLIALYDETLRDGEQMPGVAFSSEQKVQLATLLADMGIDTLAVAFPASSLGDQIALAEVLKARQAGSIRRDVELVAMCRALPADIDCALEAVDRAGGKPSDISVNILSTTSDLHMKYKLGRTLLKRENVPDSEWLTTPLEFYRDANIRLIADAITYARSRGIEGIEFSAEDASRSDLGYMTEWISACLDAGGTRLVFADTCGVLTPEAVDHYFPAVVEALGVRRGRANLTAHFHNDFGLAAINTVRAIIHGATHASVTANGIGERAGNTSLHQFAMALRELYGVRLPRFMYARLHELRRAVERASGIPIQPHEPIIGEGVFAHESGIHTAAIMIHPSIYQFIREQDVGGVQRFVLGKHSGAAAVEATLAPHAALLASHGVAISTTLVLQVLDLLKELREQQIATGGTVRAIDNYYSNYGRLGISESALIELALTAPMYSSQRAPRNGSIAPAQTQVKAP